ncbi:MULTISPECIES: hypothetical protein [Legionella]|uniref:Uncharacterized protein n=1 Tax=Legionella drozanskii LLAP-1 TaxID=1212489 RepID=A0A0W0SX35_9GAMM|nr:MULTISPECIES: hypothetical protein [Legionella]KTC87821.1 hypothetical protein Ldro_1440 [Legionella drozanskii LLAP-1]
MNHPNKEDFTHKIILELTVKYPEVLKHYIKIEIKNVEELSKKFIIVDGEWRLTSG